MASRESDGEIVDDPQQNQSSFRHDRDERSALSASGRHDRDSTQEAGGDAAASGGRLQKNATNLRLESHGAKTHAKPREKTHAKSHAKLMQTFCFASNCNKAFSNVMKL